MAALSPPRNNKKTPVRAALCGRAGLLVHELDFWTPASRLEDQFGLAPDVAGNIRRQYFIM